MPEKGPEQTTDETGGENKGSETNTSENNRTYFQEIRHNKEQASLIELAEKREAVKARYELNSAALNAGDLESIELQEQVKRDRNEFAKLSIELWRKGMSEKIDPNDLCLVAEDMASMAEKSALAELVLSRHGFKTATEALRKLNLTEVSVDELEVSLPDESPIKRLVNSPAFKEQISKLGVSGGTSLTVAGLISFLGGPITWGAVGLGVLGGIGGRYLGEKIRGKMLNKKVETGLKDEFGNAEEVDFKDKVGKDLFRLIVSMQQSAETIVSNETMTPNQRCVEILKLIEQANITETESASSYKKMERNANRIKTALSIIGAVGGSVIGNSLIQGASEAKASTLAEGKQQAIDLAKQEGVRIAHYPEGHALAGQSYITTDSTVGHEVKLLTDEAWHHVIEQKDMDAWKSLIEYSSENSDKYHYFITPGQMAEYNLVSSTNIVPTDFVPQGDLAHVSTVSDVMSAFDAKYDSAINAALAQSAWESFANVAVVGLPVAATEYGFAKHNKNKQEEIKQDDRRFISELSSTSDELSEKALLPNEYITPIGKIPFNEKPEKIKAFFERLARYWKTKLPENPAGYKENWEMQPHEIPKDQFDFSKVPTWLRAVKTKNNDLENLTSEQKIGQPIYDDTGIEIASELIPESGKIKPIEVAVAGVDYVKNRIALVHQVVNGDQSIYICTYQRLDKFLEEYVPNISHTPGSYKTEGGNTDPSNPNPPTTPTINPDQPNGQINTGEIPPDDEGGKKVELPTNPPEDPKGPDPRTLNKEKLNKSKENSDSELFEKYLLDKSLGTEDLNFKPSQEMLKTFFEMTISYKDRLFKLSADQKAVSGVGFGGSQDGNNVDKYFNYIYFSESDSKDVVRIVKNGEGYSVITGRVVKKDAPYYWDKRKVTAATLVNILRDLDDRIELAEKSQPSINGSPEQIKEPIITQKDEGVVATRGGDGKPLNLMPDLSKFKTDVTEDGAEDPGKESDKKGLAAELDRLGIESIEGLIGKNLKLQSKDFINISGMFTGEDTIDEGDIPRNLKVTVRGAGDNEIFISTGRKSAMVNAEKFLPYVEKRLN